MTSLLSGKLLLVLVRIVVKHLADNLSDSVEMSLILYLWFCKTIPRCQIMDFIHVDQEWYILQKQSYNTVIASHKSIYLNNYPAKKKSPQPDV